ncbi:glycosyltransferase family 4 protein [Tolypothrix sp. FACHB-123]|uniref:glycosyltransferase family 4 protein n=1 Tax=Tolypothrix sp. FACHB-123 TaxID=2692868 RepID=UPI0016872F6D|nr:glycosyltransferase family 4 protein [Tolypothrix sp. FACHB-123]MBD2355848.1 glycosyltransferase family 4 protein [Tolypothrix sp. FACHB-123]
MNSLPKVAILGGPDVDARIELMDLLKTDFQVSAIGSEPLLQEKFSKAGFAYNLYHLDRRVNPIADFISVIQLVSLFWQLKPQVVHAFDKKPDIWGRLAAKIAGVPVIVGTVTGLGSLYARDNWKTKLTWTIYQWLQTLICHSCDLTIFQNHDDAEEFLATGVVTQEKAKIILGSGVSTKVFDPQRVSEKERSQLRTELGIQSDEIVVTMISRVIRSKGVLEFMEAALKLQTQYPKVRFLLIGDEDKENLDFLTPTELSKLKQNVTWPGPRRDIPVVLGISDIFVFPSAYREGIPRVLLEAASMALPLIATDSPGCNEVVENDVNGFLIAPGNVAELTQAIERLIAQPELRQSFGKISRQRAIERFDIAVIAEQTSSAYRELLAAKGLYLTSASSLV